MTHSFEHSSSHEENRLVEIGISDRYAQEHPWVIQGITGFLSAYYMERPGFQVRKHYNEVETGMHVWICDLPCTMNIRQLLKRLQCDLPPSSIVQSPIEDSQPPRYLLDILGS